MDHSNILPSTCSSHQLSLTDSTGLPRGGGREPLTDSAGNSRLQGLAQDGFDHGNKEFLYRPERPMYPTAPTLHSHQPLGQTLEQRRQNNRRAKKRIYHRNPIRESPQYRAYRERQGREGNPDDQKWPEVLEEAFLEALIDIPKMGRRKFSYQGKPHGRNELIKEYIWIWYVQSLPPGQIPDPSLQRSRKQVSSHIQVLKTFFRDHPAYHRLFPPSKGPKNGFEDSFKNDPCLRALSEGRLPNKRFDHYDEIEQLMGVPQDDYVQTPLIMPTLFWLLITSTEIPDNNGRSTSEGDLYDQGIVAHQYSRLAPQQPRESLQSIPNWPQRFPNLLSLYTNNDLQCDIIHMDVCLSLMPTHPPGGAELVSRTELSIQSAKCDEMWQIITTLQKPAELSREPRVDPPVDNQMVMTQPISVQSFDTRIKVPFPANAWAHAFTCLTDVSHKSPSSVRSLVNQISMVQEVLSSPDPGTPFIRRAVILWTFHIARDGELKPVTNWRYLDPTPSRSSCMSPNPAYNHYMIASMNENFNTFMTAPLHEQAGGMINPFIHSHHGLATPPATAGLHSPFHAQSFNFTPRHSQSFDLPTQNASFCSTTTVDSESTLVETETNIDHFLANGGLNLGSYPESQDHNSWNLPTQVTESFDADPAWVNYGHLPVGETQHISSWDEPTVIVEDKDHSWVDATATMPEDTLKKENWSSQDQGKDIEWIHVTPNTAAEEHREWPQTPAQTQQLEEQIKKQEDFNGVGVMQPWMHSTHDQEHDAQNAELEHSLNSVKEQDVGGGFQTIKKSETEAMPETENIIMMQETGKEWHDHPIEPDDDFDYAKLAQLK